MVISRVKPIKYVRHAKNRMRHHAVSEKEVETAIKSPAFLEPSIEGRLNAWVKTSERFLRVTYKEDAHVFTVITAVKKKKGWR